jgi:hypothetical protein
LSRRGPTRRCRNDKKVKYIMAAPTMAIKQNGYQKNGMRTRLCQNSWQLKNFLALTIFAFLSPVSGQGKTQERNYTLYTHTSSSLDVDKASATESFTLGNMKIRFFPVFSFVSWLKKSKSIFCVFVTDIQIPFCQVMMTSSYR